MAGNNFLCELRGVQPLLMRAILTIGHNSRHPVSTTWQWAETTGGFLLARLCLVRYPRRRGASSFHHRALPGTRYAPLEFQNAPRVRRCNLDTLDRWFAVVPAGKDFRGERPVGAALA